jgi:hypothetical protein
MEVWGWVVYETIKIYSEKFTTNNSENNYKLSYTPKPLYTTSFLNWSWIILKHPGKTRTHLPEIKITNKKKDNQTNDCLFNI